VLNNNSNKETLRQPLVVKVQLQKGTLTSFFVREKKRGGDANGNWKWRRWK